MGTDGQPNGWDYVREFCKQLPNGCVNSSSAVYKGVADGESPWADPSSRGAATFIGHSNLFHATLSKKDGRTELCFPSGYRLPMTTLSDEYTDGQAVVVGIRPEEFSVSCRGLCMRRAQPHLPGPLQQLFSCISPTACACRPAQH